jgi:redox-regulated HSP33 family molecular chaperone
MWHALQKYSTLAIRKNAKVNFNKAAMLTINAVQKYDLNKLLIYKVYFHSSFQIPKASVISVSVALTSQVCASLMLLFWL